MRIGIDIRPLIEEEWGGVSWYTYYLLKSLFNLFKVDYQNSYFLFYNSYKSAKHKLPNFEAPNVHYLGFRCPNKLLNLSIKFFEIPRINELVGGLDVFWFPNINFICASKNSYTLLTVHDLSFERFPEFCNFKRKLWHKFINPKKVCQAMDKIVAVSLSTKKDLIELYGLEESKIQVIYSGVDLTKFRVIEDRFKLESVRKKYNLPEDFILYLSTIEPRKNAAGLLDAFKKLNRSGIKLVIAGNRGWSSKSIYRKAAGSKDIIFVNQVEEKDKEYIYNLATLFAYPSFYEGFGLPPLEAMSCGVPVVASNCSSIPEIVEDAALLVDPWNINEIALGIETLLDDESLRDNFIKKGLKQAKKFNWGNSAQKLLDLFNKSYANRY